MRAQRMAHDDHPVLDGTSALVGRYDARQCLSPQGPAGVEDRCRDSPHHGNRALHRR